MNSQQVLLSLNGSLSSTSFNVPYLEADETYAAIEYGDYTTVGTTSADFIVIGSTFISSFTINSYGPITLTFNPSAIKLPNKISRIVYSFSDGSPDIIHSFYYAPTSTTTANYPYPNEPGDPRNFTVTKTFYTSQYFTKTFNVIAKIYQYGIIDSDEIYYTINIISPQINGKNPDGSVTFEEINLISTRMFGVNNDILYVFETKNPNYILPVLINWNPTQTGTIVSTNTTPLPARSYKLLQPYEIDGLTTNENINLLPIVNSENSIADGGAS